GAGRWTGRRDGRRHGACHPGSKRSRRGRATRDARESSGRAGSDRLAPQRLRSVRAREPAMLFVIHAADKKDGMATRAKFYRAHRIHLDQAEDHQVNVVTAGTLLADDGETPVGSVFVIDASSRAAVDAFARSDPYHVNRVWERIQIHGYNKKRGTPMA